MNRIVAEYIINKLLSKPDRHIRNKIKVVLDLTNYDPKKELDYSDLAAKKILLL